MTLRLPIALCVLLVALPGPAVADCLFAGNMTPFNADTVAPVDSAEVPVPEIESSRLVRGAGGGASCDGLGFLTVELRWPRGSRYPLGEVGFEYRLVSGDAPKGLFATAALASPVNGRRAEHQFSWEDVPPEQQRPMPLVLEVRAVTRDHRRGAPARIVIGQ